MKEMKKWLVGWAVLAYCSSVHAQEAPRLRFRPGEVLQFRVEQTTRVTQTLDGENQTFESRTELIKRWEILEAGLDGPFTLQLTIPQLKLLQKLPSGQTIAYDSTQPEGSHPALRQQMEQFLGKPTVKLKIDSRGQVLHSQPLVSIPVGQLGSEPPFAIVLPEQPWQPQSRWTRPYSLLLEPPLGTGEKYQAEQQFELRSLHQHQAEIVWQTHIPNPPATASERIPLLQKLTRGTALFDTNTHRITLIRMQAGGTVEGHEGANSKYEFSSEYIERLLP